MKYKIKKLPRYWLGTRTPTSLGYQPNYGIGNVLFTNTPGLSLSPEIQTIKSNAIPGALNKLQQTSSLATTALSNIYGPSLAKTGAKSAAKIGANTLGAVMGGVGTVAGGIDMGFQIAGNKDYRHPGEMRNNLGTNTYTTDLGNTYTTKSGLDLSAERRYAEAERKRKNLEFTATSIGTGMSAGLLAGSLIGTSAAPGIGTAIGAGVGALGGLIAYGLGFGDTEEETKNAISNLENSLSMENRMSESSALDKDVKQGFYGRTKSGNIAQAAKGKLPRFAKGKVNALVSNGEIQGNLKEGWAFLYGGVPNNDDKIKTHVDKSDYIVSNPFVPYVKATGDIVGALTMQDMVNRNKKDYKSAPLKAKCGKMPKYALGTVGEYVASLLPHAVQLEAAGQQYRRDYNTPTYVPKMEADYSGAINSAYRMMSDLIDKRPYLNQSNDAFRQAAWNLRRNPGYGYGGRMIGYDSLFRSKLAQDAQTSLNIDLQNLAQRNKAEAALLTLLGHSTDINNQNMGAWIAMTQQANAAKENALRQDLYNLTVPIAGAASDYLRVADTNAARAYKERIANMYDRLLTLEELRTLKDWLDSDSENTKGDVSSIYNLYKLSTPDLLSLYRSYADRLSDKLGRQFTLTPPILYYMNPGYSYRNIPNLTYILR